MTRIAHSVTARLLAAALLLVSSSCDSESGGGTHVVLISEMRMVLGTDDDGSLRGMNLDDRVDEVGSPDTCNKVDGVAPDGTPGIDNQFSILGGLVVSQLGGNADALIQSSINDGRLLILLELLNVDNLENDNDVTVRIHVGSGPVDVGTNGRPEPGQSFDISEMSAPIEVRDVRIVDGRIDIHPFDINVNVDILQAMFFLTLLESRIQVERVDVKESGTEGVLNIEVIFKVRSTNSRYNLVYPFYLEEAVEQKRK